MIAVSNGSLTGADADYRKLVEDKIIELDDVQARHDDPTGVIRDEVDYVMSNFSDREILEVFVAEVSGSEISEDLTFEEMRYSVYLDAVDRVSSEVMG